jgi:hypothetical protein
MMSASLYISYNNMSSTSADKDFELTVINPRINPRTTCSPHAVGHGSALTLYGIVIESALAEIQRSWCTARSAIIHRSLRGVLRSAARASVRRACTSECATCGNTRRCDVHTHAHMCDVLVHSAGATCECLCASATCSARVTSQPN